MGIGVVVGHGAEKGRWLGGRLDGDAGDGVLHKRLTCGMGGIEKLMG
jgi:hypothetical protein